MTAGISERPTIVAGRVTAVGGDSSPDSVIGDRGAGEPGGL